MDKLPYFNTKFVIAKLKIVDEFFQNRLEFQYKICYSKIGSSD